MRRLVSLALAVAVLAALAAACSGADPVAESAAVPVEATPTVESSDDALPRIRHRTVRLEAVVVGAEGTAGRQLSLLFIGGRAGVLEDDPCAGEYEAEVDESAGEISVTVYELALVDAEPVDCSLEGHSRELVVELDQTVGERAVIDGHDDSQHWVIDPAAVLWPQSLPDGWVVRSRSASDDTGLVSRYGPATTSDESIMLVVVPADAESERRLVEAMNEVGTSVRELTIRGSASAVELISDESGSVTIAFDEDGFHYLAIAYGGAAINALDPFVAGLELDPTSRTFEIPFEAPIILDPAEGGVIPTPTATPPPGDDPLTPRPVDDAPDGPPAGDQMWPASESTRDVANYLEALRQGAYEQAAWPAANNGVEFDGQTTDETGAEYLERACGDDLCQGPYLIRAEPGYISPLTSQAMAAVSVMHLASGEATTMTLFTFEGQRMINSLPPLVASENDASLRESLFGDAVPQRVIVERFDAFEIWDGAATEWVTNWHAEDVVQIEGDVVSTGSGAFGLTDPLQDHRTGCPRLLDRGGQVLAVDQCVSDQWTVSNLTTGDQVDAPVPFEDAGESELLWFDERGGAVVTGTYDAEGNLFELRSASGIDLLGDDYASLAVISTDGHHIAYVDHRDPAALSHFWSPVLVVRDVATGSEVGQWTLDSAVSCLEYAVDWVVACEADNDTLATGIPEQRALVAINPTTGDVNRVDTATQVFLPTG